MRISDWSSDVCSSDLLSHAAAVLGPTVFERVPDLDPCWRDLIVDLANHVEVTWRSGTRPVPPWIEGPAIRLETTAACEPGSEERRVGNECDSTCNSRRAQSH